MIALCVGLALLTLLVVRYHWLMWQVERYSIVASWWVIRTKQGVVVADEMSALWPLSRIMWDLVHWNLRHYVVHQHHYDAMTEWLSGELARTDITWDVFVAACRAHDATTTAASASPGAAAALNQEPADPSRN